MRTGSSNFSVARDPTVIRWCPTQQRLCWRYVAPRPSAALCARTGSSRSDLDETECTLTKQWAPLLFRLISRSIPPEQPIFEVERHLAESHLCKSQEAIEIILWVGIHVNDGNVTRTEIVLPEQYACAKPSYVSHPPG